MVAALSDRVGVVILVVGALLFALAIAWAMLQRSRARDRGPDIPPAMKPGPADAALETPLLQKLQGWAVLLVGIMAVWIPASWLFEPSRNLHQEDDLRTLAIERGYEATLPNSEENLFGVGCTRCHGPKLEGGLLIPNGVNADGSIKYDVSANLTEVCKAHGTIKSVDDIYATIEQGRPGTPMPSWSIRYQGALDDQQINDLVSYLISYSSKFVPFSENICTNPDAAKAAVSPSPSASGSASPSAAPSTSPSPAVSPQVSVQPSGTA